MADERRARIALVYQRGLAADRRAYDPARHLIGHLALQDPAVRVYRAAQSLPFAHALLREGDAGSIRQAAATVAAVLDTQERSPYHPHRGNFLWLADDREVVDLNAVQFVLRGLLPLLVEQGSALPPDLLGRCREAVRLALEEEERLDVAPTYTNIHLMSLFALLAGGQWLGEARFQDLGRQRWARWVRFTVQSGAPHEYNSPGYGAVDLGALAALQQFVRDPVVRLQARLMYERLWLHLGLHLHRPTGQLAGPHCRCYWGAMMSGQNPVKDLLWCETGWPWLLEPGPYGGRPVSELPAALERGLTRHWLPEALRAWLVHQEQAMPYEIRETANATDGADLTTYCTPSYALGTAARTYSIGQDDFYIEHQANYLLLHYARPGRPGGWGMLYCRYVVNDQHWGTRAAAPDRSRQANFYDYGNFAGLQYRNKAIALYALQPQHEEIFSLKTVVVFPQADLLDEVWVNERRVAMAELPWPLRAGDWVVVADGAVYAGLYPLEPSCLGREAPILLERGPQDELWLTMYNYRGPAKRFWDYASLRGAFWHGNVRAGFVIEVAERSAYPSAPAFLSHLRRAVIRDTVEATPECPTLRTVVYQSGGDELVLRYDLWRTEPGERRINGVVYRPPMLSSALAVQGDSGRLAAGQAVLETAPQAVWLIAQELDPQCRAWIAVNPEDRPAPLRLETPCGVVTAARWGLGRLEVRAPADGISVLRIDAAALPEGLHVPEGVRIEFEQRHAGLA
jgi:hypothetical protein